ncbi:hypothetical protein [Actinacidiphila rubida]|uniref:Uncharacterized protein n=1 Tax=Actinacidiphila rubida TaxID=310780 RepID=A0A1H8L8I5_9ACTN|nr:hypothetical protein [Actinacidiphila rubida]SEO01494.1 hypothetical protein SAMN05216267_1015100 [Actinacidiphila rubida]
MNDFTFVRADRAALMVGLFVDDHAVTVSAMPLLGYRHRLDGHAVPVFDDAGRPTTQAEVEANLCGGHLQGGGCRKLVALYDATDPDQADAAWRVAGQTLDAMIS